MSSPLSPLEWEVIGLCLTLEALDEMLHYGMVDLVILDDRTAAARASFLDSAQKELFWARFLGFLESRGDLGGGEASHWEGLQAAVDGASFERCGSLEALSKAVRELEDWLKEAKMVRCSLLGREVTLELSRLDQLRILVARSKASQALLVQVSRDLASSLGDSGAKPELAEVLLEMEKAPLALAEEGSWMIERLNDLRWGLQAYLKPIWHERANHAEAFGRGIESEIGRLWLSRLLDQVRHEPILRRFRTPES